MNDKEKSVVAENAISEIPFEIKYQEAKNSIYNLINDMYAKGIPFYLMETIVSDILHQIQFNAKIEMETSYKKHEESYKKSLWREAVKKGEEIEKNE